MSVFMTPVDAADYLGGLNARTVTRWAREGYLPSFPIGEGKRRLWRFLEQDLKEWMLARRIGHSPMSLEAGRATLQPAIGPQSGSLND